MAGEELPPVVAVLEGDDASFLAMLERDIEAARGFAADLQAALEEGIGGITVSGASVTSEGIGAAGAAIGEELSAGIGEGLGGLNLQPEMEASVSGAAEAGQAAGSEIAAGITDAVMAGADEVSAEIASALRDGAAAGAAQAEEEIGAAFTGPVIREFDRTGVEAGAAFSNAFAGSANLGEAVRVSLTRASLGAVLGDTFAALSSQVSVSGALTASLSDAAAEAGGTAGAELARNLIEAATATLGEADLAAFTDRLVEATGEAGAAAGTAAADGIGMGLSAGLAETGLLAEGIAQAGQGIETGAVQAAQSAAQAVAGVQAATLSGAQAYEAELDAVFEAIYRGGEGMTVQLAAAMVEAFQGIETDTEGFTAAELRIFDSFYRTLQEQGDQAALDLAQRTRLISAFAASGPQADMNLSSIGVPFPEKGTPAVTPAIAQGPEVSVPGLAVAGEARAAASATEEVGAAATNATEALGGMAGVMGGPLMFGLLGAVSILPMFSGLLSSNSQAAQQAAQDHAALQQAVSQDSDMVGANTVATITNQLATGGAADTLQGYGISLSQATAAMAGNKGAQDEITGSLNAQITNLQALISEQEAHTQNTDDQINKERDQVVQLEDTRDAMKGLEQDVVGAVDKQNELAQATLYASQAVDVFDVQVQAGVISLKQQAQQADVSAQATAIYLMTLVPGTEAYKSAVVDQEVALEKSAVTTQINNEALNDSLPLWGQVGSAALQAVDDYQRTSAATGLFTNAITALFGQYGQASGAQAAFTTALDGLKGNITSGTDAVNLNTEAGAKNFQAFEQVAQAAEGASEKIYQQTGDAGQAALALQDMAGKLDTAAYKAGLTKDQVHQLNQELFGVPSIKDITISLLGVQGAKDILDGLTATRTVFIQSEIADINSPAVTGHSHGIARAAGGPVSAGELYVVGESGKPEWFVPGADGYITPMDMVQTSGFSGGPGGDFGFGGGSTVVNVYLDGQLVTRGVRAESQYVKSRNSTTGF